MISEQELAILKKMRKKKVLSHNQFCRKVVRFLANDPFATFVGVLNEVGVSRNQFYGWKRHEIYQQHYKTLMLAKQIIEENISKRLMLATKEDIPIWSKLLSRIGMSDADYEKHQLENDEVKTEQMGLEISFKNDGSNKI